MKNKSENRTMNAYFCAVTFCFPPPKPLPLPLLVLLPASRIATGGLGFPVFFFEDARIVFFFFFFKRVTSSFELLLFAFLQQRSRLSVLSSLQKHRRTEETYTSNERETNASLSQSHDALKDNERIKQLINKDRLYGTKASQRRLCFYHPYLEERS